MQKENIEYLTSLRYSTMSAVATLIYMEYLRSFTQIGRRVHVPKTNLIEYGLQKDDLMNFFENDFLDKLVESDDIFNFIKEDKSSIQKYLVATIIPEFQKIIPEVIERKFENDQIFHQTMDISFMCFDWYNDDKFIYILEETRLKFYEKTKNYKYLVKLPKFDRMTTNPDGTYQTKDGCWIDYKSDPDDMEYIDKMKFISYPSDCFIIHNQNEISPIIINEQIRHCEVYNLITFITNLSIMESNDVPMKYNRWPYDYEYCGNTIEDHNTVYEVSISRHNDISRMII